MTGRKIFFILILAIIGIVVLTGANKWRENHIILKEMEINKLYTTQMPASTPTVPGKDINLQPGPAPQPGTKAAK